MQLNNAIKKIRLKVSLCRAFRHAKPVAAQCRRKSFGVVKPGDKSFATCRDQQVSKLASPASFQLGFGFGWN